MEFHTSFHQAAYVRVHELLVEAFGRQRVLANRHEPKFLIQLGEPSTIVHVEHFQGSESTVTISHLLDNVIIPGDVRDRADILTFFLRESYEIPFAAFALCEESGVYVVFLQYSLLASGCTAEGLSRLILRSQKLAAEYNAMNIGRTIRDTRFVSGTPGQAP